jgi:hypothetical protein
MDRPGCSCLNIPLMFTVACLWLLGTVGALALWQWAPPFIDSSYGIGHQPFELLGMFLSILAVGTVLWLARGEASPDGKHWASALLWLLPVLAAIHQVSEYGKPSWDWKCYVGGAEALLAGGMPYADCYLYPPLLAQLFAWVYPLFHLLGEGLGLGAPKHWMLVFFAWHSFQVLMVGLTTLLLNRLARRHGFSVLLAAAIVALLLLVNTPLERTIRHNQVNLIVLNLVLLALDRVDPRPGLSGALVALAGHIKLLPVVLLAAFVFGKRWAAVTGFMLVGGVLALVQVGLAEPAGMWGEFFTHAPKFVQGEYFRDNSLTGLIFNLIRVPIDLMGGDIKGWQRPLRSLGMLISLGAGAVVLSRMHFRQDTDWLGSMSLALMLLLSPVAWEHHYVWALPLSVLSLATFGRQQPARVGIAVLLMFGLPTFDVFPLSYHRLAGLLILLHLHLGQGLQRTEAEAAS